MKKITRRLFLDSTKKFLAFLPFVNVIGCTQDQSSKLSPEDSLKKLIYVIGPWTKEDNLIAEDFANRFIKASQIVSQFIPKSSTTIQNLSARFSEEDFAVREIDLDRLSIKERELLIALGKQLYDLVEVRFFVAKVPSWGQCIGDPLWHTKAP